MSRALSYSARLKQELYAVLPKARHCRIAELRGLFLFGGRARCEGGVRHAAFISEQPETGKLFFTLLEKTINIKPYVRGAEAADSGDLSSIIPAEVSEEFLQMEKIEGTDTETVDRTLLMQPCCRRAFLRAAFLSAGSVTDPRKGYHFEIVARTDETAALIRDLMTGFGLGAKIVGRQGHQVVYLKESDDIRNMIGVMEAPVTLMNFENIRIEKDLHNTVNRKVNCETANIGKMVDAAVREISDIRLIESAGMMESLPAKLQETARLRLQYPEIPLKDLGKKMDPPVGKSGVNHRLRRISEIAGTLRQTGGEEGK